MGVALGHVRDRSAHVHAVAVLVARHGVFLAVLGFHVVPAGIEPSLYLLAEAFDPLPLRYGTWGGAGLGGGQTGARSYFFLGCQLSGTVPLPPQV